MANTEYVLWGLPKGSTDRLDEKVLYTQGKTQEQIETLKIRAAADGWHSFRVQVLNLDEKPDFKKAITTFPNEVVLLKIGKETLVQTDALHRSGKQYVAITRNGRTDFPIVYESGLVAYDYPEWFSKKFKDAVQRKIGKVAA